MKEDRSGAKCTPTTVAWPPVDHLTEWHFNRDLMPPCDPHCSKALAGPFLWFGEGHNDFITPVVI